MGEREHLRKPGEERPAARVIGNSEPAKNHGTIATAGTRPMYSSCVRTRLASVSATPYMPTAKSVGGRE